MAGRRREWTRVGSDLEWVGLGRIVLGARDVVLALVRDRDLGESGGVAVGLARRSEDG